MTEKRFLIILLLTLIYLPLWSQDALKEGMSLERLGRYEDYIQSEIDSKNINGAVSLILRNGKVVHQKAFGFSDSDRKRSMQTDDLFYIQSMTKPIITTAFMMLYEEGHFFLWDPVSKYIPEFANLRVAKDPNMGIESETEELNTEVTIHHLLTHTAGFSHGLGPTKLDQDVFMDQYFEEYENVEERMMSALEIPLIGQPGEQWYYSVAPDVLSVLIEKFSGIPTNQFLQTRLLDPLGMTNTTYNVDKKDKERVVFVVGADTEGGAFQQPKSSGVKIWSGVNGLFSTAEDYMIFTQMLMNGGSWDGKQYLSRKTVELMVINQVGDLFPDPGYGFGYGFRTITDLPGNMLQGSEGLFNWSGAFNTHHFVDPSENLIAVFLTQSNPYDQKYHNKMRQLIYQAVVD